MSRICPGTSRRRARWPRDSGTKAATSTTAMTTRGALSQNTARQSRIATSAPPMTGPAAMLSPNTDPQTPIAFARSLGSGIAFTTIANATGLSIEAPTPWSTRAATKSSADGAKAHRVDAIPNVTRPVRNTRRRPHLSAIAPEVMSRLANAIVYASTTHSSARVLAPRSAPISGRATFTIVVSSPTRKIAAAQTTSTAQRRRLLRAGAGGDNVTDMSHHPVLGSERFVAPSLDRGGAREPRKFAETANWRRERGLDEVLGAIGPRLRRLRRDRGVTLQALADETGLSTSTLSRLESGKRNPTLDLLLPLARPIASRSTSWSAAPATGDPRVHLKARSAQARERRGPVDDVSRPGPGVQTSARPSPATARHP